MKNPNTYTKQQRSLGGLNKPRRYERFEEIIGRAYDDRKGTTVIEGVNYTAVGESSFKVIHSHSHRHRFDVVHNGHIIKTANARSLPTKWLRKRAKLID